MKVYLAGPLPTDNDWRNELKKLLLDHKDIILFDPASFENTTNDGTVVNYDKSIIKKCDIIVANITRTSFGTPMEILFAWPHNIPVILTGEQKLLDHYWLRFHSSFIRKNITEVSKLLIKHKSLL